VNYPPQLVRPTCRPNHRQADRPLPSTASPFAQVCYPLPRATCASGLSFDKDPFCLSRLPRSARGNSFLLINIWTAHVWRVIPAAGSLSPLFATLTETTGVYPKCSLSRETSRDQSRTRPSSSPLPLPSDTEDSLQMTDDCRQMPDDFSISSIPGTFRPTPAYFYTTARSSTAPGTRLGRLR